MQTSLPAHNPTPVKSKGSRLEVWTGKALKTTGGLTKADLKMRNGRIISVRKSNQALLHRGNQAGLERWRTACRLVLLRDGHSKFKIITKQDPLYTKARTIMDDREGMPTDTLFDMLAKEDTSRVFTK